MKNKYKLILYSLILLMGTGCARIYLDKANREFENMSYLKAVKYYQRCLERKEISEARVNLAHSYRLMNDIDKAEREYARVIGIGGIEPINTFYYAKMLMEQERYDDAKIYFASYLEKEPDDIVARMLLASCNSVYSYKIDTSLFTLQPVDLGNIVSMFGSVSYKNGIVFTAEKNVKLNSRKNPWTGNSYLDLYFTQKGTDGKWLAPQLLKGELNGQYHEGPATFSKSGDVVYFTRSNYYKYRLGKSSKGENNLKIFRAELVNGKWEKLEELPFNNDEYSVGHPCLSNDGKTLFFVSDMPGGAGGTDLYLSTFDGKNWSSPVNLGPTINTPGNEMFPYVYQDGSFYFASDAHNNMGGLDVFVTYNDGKNWLRPENLNYPLNSSKDDFAYIQADDSTGYVSSSRSDTDRIYQFKKHQPKFSVEGIVLDKKTRKPIANAVVKIMGDKKLILNTDINGRYKTTLNPNNYYLIIASMKDYFSHSEDVKTKGEKYSKTFVINFYLTEMVIEKPIVLENIYYDFDKWEIRSDAALELDKLVRILNDNPSIDIELGSHTDSRAGDQYNLILSDKRAKAAVDYLVSKGINAHRLKWKGYGESKPVNKCTNLVACSETEHQANRRTEFKVIRITLAIAEH